MQSLHGKIKALRSVSHERACETKSSTVKKRADRVRSEKKEIELDQRVEHMKEREMGPVDMT
jgi:hypothetical protein